MDISRYVKSIVKVILDSADIKKLYMPHGRILPTSFNLISKELSITPDDSRHLEEAPTLDYASCI
jgi:hypothetical protein